MTDPTDRWFPASVTSARIARAHVMFLDEAFAAATVEVLAAFDADPLAPDVWDAFARLCAETDFDPTDFVAAIPDDHVLEVLASLRASAPPGVDRIAELIWDRNLGDPRVLGFGAVVRGEARQHARAGVVGAHPFRRHGPAVPAHRPRRRPQCRRGRADPGRVRSPTPRSAIPGRAARSTQAVPDLPDDELIATLTEVWALAAMLADAFVVAAATTPARSLLIASVLFEGGAHGEAYAVLVHGLSLESADALTTEIVVDLMPLPVLEGLAAEAEERGEDDVAGILEAVAVVAATASASA